MAKKKTVEKRNRKKPKDTVDDSVTPIQINPPTFNIKAKSKAATVWAWVVVREAGKHFRFKLNEHPKCFDKIKTAITNGNRISVTDPKGMNVTGPTGKKHRHRTLSQPCGD